ncbi:MAG: hypothetical protein ABIA75_03965 [Candidatus Neomarinimicrobiota bacterium]
MKKNELTLYIVTAVAGLLLLLLIYAPSILPGPRPAGPESAPVLSALPFHMSFVNEDTCLQCHREARQINLKGEIMEAQAIAHEPRTNCTACHRLPNMM